VKLFTLIAVDPEGRRREYPLSEERYTVGRDPGEEWTNPLPVAGDRHLSRVHFSLQVQPEKVVVRRSERGRNPLYFNGEESDLFTVRPGQVFYTGKTQFGILLGRETHVTTHHTLARKAKEDARLRRLEDCFTAVLELLRNLRKRNETPAWQTAFPVLRSILPEVHWVAFLQMDHGSTTFRVIDKDPQDSDPAIEKALLERALSGLKTVTSAHQSVDLEGAEDRTLNPNYSWSIASPVKGLERARYLLYVSGGGSLERETLEERATLVDLVTEMVGHHIVIRQGSEYSSLLGVFGHHIGTLFKTSGALELWTSGQTNPEVKQVLENLLPIWGISQAISLHKKRGEKARKALLETWVKSDQVTPYEIEEALLSVVRHVYHTGSEEPFLTWTLNDEPLSKSGGLLTLPPLDDVPQLLDKTLALTIGLLEVLHNVRKYPASRGSGREDRRDLARLRDEEREVKVSVTVEQGQGVVEIEQPVVTTHDGSIPRSRSLQRIRALEETLLGALVGTEPAEIVSTTSVPHVVRVRHRWNYHYGQLLKEWREHHGA